MSVRLGLIWPQTGGLWTAGNLYFENLLTSVSLAGRAADVTVIEPSGGSYSRSARTMSDVAVVTFVPPVEPSSRLGVVARLIRRQLRLPDANSRAVTDSGVSVVFGEADAQTRFPTPWVGWIPDFQHLHYPQFFSTAEVASRNQVFSRLAERATSVLLSSQSALEDFVRFAPMHAHKGKVASFVSLFDDGYLDRDPLQTASGYGISAPFIIVPNQWWQHKNHEVALRAAALLRDRGVDAQWVFTGALADYRDFGHVSRLLQLISRLGLRDRIVILGALPRADQVQLMRAAACIVQPSLFEGWSTVVEDAKTLGQRIVVSDIPVHREQEPPNSLYFDPLSPEDLADNVVRMLDGARKRGNEHAAMEASLQRAAVFGARFCEVCDEAAGSR